MGSSVSIPRLSGKTMVGVSGGSAPKLQPVMLEPVIPRVPNVRLPDSRFVMWSLPPGDTVLQMLTYVALTAGAMTAALAAGRRSMDWAGVAMLGCVTALGGGTIRDVLLGHYPLVWVQHPSYLLLTAGAALATSVMPGWCIGSIPRSSCSTRSVSWSSPWPAATWPGRSIL